MALDSIENPLLTPALTNGVRPSTSDARTGHEPSAPRGASRLLSTLNEDGTRRWMKPRLSPGRFLSARRAAAYLLIAIFASLPLIRINGYPVVLLDIIGRKFHIFGATFYPTDTLLLAVLAVGVFLTIFWVTALLGRVWCGWACPQTVYMEFVFRPVERLFEGPPGRDRGGIFASKAAGRIAKLFAYLAICLILAHVFLAYFVPWSDLRHWVLGSPFEHPLGFFAVALVTAVMLFDFGYFREQMCLLACPYGRFQSVMLDRHSVVIQYDRARGEPRGKKRATVSLPVFDPKPVNGDCIDCGMCVATCPTGIDIRNGLQMECVGCAQCIDACDTVMDKIGRSRGLIRYSSQAVMAGEKFRTLRPRIVLYPLAVLSLGGLFVFKLVTAGPADVMILRGLGQPFTVLPDGQVRNTIRVKIANRLNVAADFALTLDGPGDARLQSETVSVSLQAGQMATVPAEIDAPQSAFKGGQTSVVIVVTGPEKSAIRRPFTLVGPRNSTNVPPKEDSHGT